jgi:prevent-host-death family protein
MAKTVNVHEAKTHLSRLLQEVERGREIVIARAGRPVARLVAAEPVAKRELGQELGQIWLSPDFDEPMPDDWLDEWER